MQEPDTTEKMLDAERDVQARLGDRPLDFEANRAISNIYRAAASSSQCRARAAEAVRTQLGRVHDSVGAVGVG